MVIKSAERDRYIGALQNADLGRVAPLAGFMLESVLWSLGLAIRAAKGESLRESEDVGKEIALFVRRHRAGEPKASDVELLDDVVSQWIRPTLDRVKKELEPLGELFATSSWQFFVEHGQRGVVQGVGIFGGRLWESIKETHVVLPGFRLSNEQRLKLESRSLWRHYTGREGKTFSLELSLIWEFDEEGVVFSVKIDSRPIFVQRVRYAEVLTLGAEVDRTEDFVSQAMMAEIDHRSAEQE